MIIQAKSNTGIVKHAMDLSQALLVLRKKNVYNYIQLQIINQGMIQSVTKELPEYGIPACIYEDPDSNVAYKVIPAPLKRTEIIMRGYRLIDQ
jgi:hypothetical protein